MLTTRVRSIELGEVEEGNTDIVVTLVEEGDVRDPLACTCCTRCFNADRGEEGERIGGEERRGRGRGRS